MIIEESYTVQNKILASWFEVDPFSYGLSLGTTYQDAQKNYLKLLKRYPNTSYRIIKSTKEVVENAKRI